MKKHIIIPTVLLTVFAGLFASCSKYYGEPLTRNIPVDGDYSKVKVSHAFDVTVCDTITEAVVVLPEKLHDKLKFQVVNGVLEIGYKSSLTVSNDEATVLLPLNPQLKDIDLSGASSFRGDLNGTSCDLNISGASNFFGNITASSVEFDVSGASDVLVYSLNADEVDADISGSSSVTLAGSCTGTMDIEVSGSSRLRAPGFATDAVTGELSGSSDADVTVCNRIAVKVSGASELTYGTTTPDCRPEYRCTTSGASNVTPR